MTIESLKHNANRPWETVCVLDIIISRDRFVFHLLLAGDRPIWLAGDREVAIDGLVDVSRSVLDASHFTCDNNRRVYRPHRQFASAY